MDHSKRLSLRHSCSILQDATCSILQTAPRVKIVGECTSQSSDDGGAFPRHLHFVKRLSASLFFEQNYNIINIKEDNNTFVIGKETGFTRDLGEA